MKIYDFSVRTAQGTLQSLQAFENKVFLIVNVASACGFTPQYEGLQSLYNEFKDQGLIVLGFPCNQFGSQESGSDTEIQEFCKTTFDVDFPVFAKINVNGEDADPVYKFLKEQAPGLLGTEAIKWNFTKFLISKDGQTVKRYAPNTKPEDLRADVMAELNK